MKKKEEYIVCPRCELNYIVKKDKFCSVCKAEMNGDSAYEDLDLEVCPICKVNFIRPDEIMCASCAKEHSLAGVNLKEDLSEDEWHSYLNSEDEKEDIVDEDEETGEMVRITDIDDEIEEIEIDPELAEEFKDEEDIEEEEIEDLDDEEDVEEEESEEEDDE